MIPPTCELAQCLVFRHKDGNCQACRTAAGLDIICQPFARAAVSSADRIPPDDRSLSEPSSYRSSSLSRSTSRLRYYVCKSSDTGTQRSRTLLKQPRLWTRECSGRSWMLVRTESVLDRHVNVLNLYFKHVKASQNSALLHFSHFKTARDPDGTLFERATPPQRYPRHFPGFRSVCVR